MFRRSCHFFVKKTKKFTPRPYTGVSKPFLDKLCKANPIQRTGTKKLIETEKAYSARNYSPLPIVFSKAKNVTVWDPEGHRYLDFLSAYGAVSHGHSNPRLLKVVKKQLGRVTLSSRAFHNDVFASYAKFITKFFGYDCVLPMNTGAEGVETSLKLARKWGYRVKKIPQDKALIVCCTSNFHGRTFGAVAMCDDPNAFGDYGPKLPGILTVKYGDAAALERIFKKHGKRIAAFICEPIQGEAGVNIPPAGYLKDVRRLTTQHNILYIDDEVQAGCARTGAMLAVDHEGVRPDVVILAKALGGGILPVAAVLADHPVMGVFTPGTHGSTFGGNPVACALGIESLRVIHQEKLCEKSRVKGKFLLDALRQFKRQFPCITTVRGRGLFCAMEFDPKAMKGEAATTFTRLLKEHGVLAKTTHGHIIRLSPPLTIEQKVLEDGIARIGAALRDLQRLMDKTKKK